MAAAAALALAMPAAAQDAFRIGVVALPGEEAAIDDLAATKSAYSTALGLPVEVMAARSYAALAEAQIEGRIDYGVYSAAAFAAASLRCGCLSPVAAPVDADGTVGLRAVLIARGDGTGRLAVGAPDSLATRLVPLAASPQARAAQAEGRLVEAGSAAEAEALFVAGRVDGFFGWVPAGAEDGEDAGGSLARLGVAGVDPASFRIVWRSPLLRYGPHAVRDDIAPERAERLARLLEGVAGGGANPGRRILRGHGGFAAVTAADYAPAMEAVSALSNPGR
jgi:phosphonate transport system substrate-binding protein